MIWNEINSLIENNHRFIISSHQSLDGDSIGSQLAMYWYLTSLGKEVTLFDYDPVPSKFTFLHNADRFQNTKDDRVYDVLVVLDCSNPNRMGWEESEKIAPLIINIDHHRDNSRFGTVNIVNTAAAATGEIIYQFFTESGISYPTHVAESLYAAILSDTGGFRFSNTNSRIFKICADLSEKGTDCSKVYEKVFATHPKRVLLLQSKIWSTLRFLLDGKVCMMEMPLSILNDLEAIYSDSEGMADHTITAHGVEVGMLLKYSDSETHFSLRSKGNIDVGKIAQKIPGGGGHYSAAGCTIKESRDKALALILEIIASELD